MTETPCSGTLLCVQAGSRERDGLDDSGLRLGPLGLGCAGLMQLPTRRQRQRLLHTAIDSGIHHFDAARLYGLGAAEREVGRLAGTRRDELTVATKFGLAPSANAERLAPFQGPARYLLRKSQGIRSTVKARGDAAIAPRRYDVAGARASLDRSLQELGLDHVDLLLIHEPRAVDEVDAVGLRAFLEGALQQGKIRAFGASQDHLSDFAIEQLGSRAVLQIRDTVLDRPAVARPRVTFAVLADVVRAVDRWVKTPEAAAEWHAETGVDPTDRYAIGWLVLAEALASNADGTVLFASVDPSRVSHAAAIAAGQEPASEDAIAGLRRFVAARNVQAPAHE